MRTLYITAAIVISSVSALGCNTRQTTSPADAIRLAACISPYFNGAKPAIETASAAIADAKTDVQNGHPITIDHIDAVAPVVLGASGVIACFEKN